MYLKIAGNQNNSQHNIKDFSLGLANNEKIIDIEVLNKDQLLIVEGEVSLDEYTGNSKVLVNALEC